MHNLIILAWSCLWLAAIQIFSHLLRAFTQGVVGGAWGEKSLIQEALGGEERRGVRCN